ALVEDGVYVFAFVPAALRLAADGRAGGGVWGGGLHAPKLGGGPSAGRGSIQVGPVGLEGAGAGRRQAAEALEVLGGEGEIEGGHVLLQVRAPLGAGDGHDVVALGRQPRQGHLAGRGAGGRGD